MADKTRRDFLRLAGTAAAGLFSLWLPSRASAVWVPTSYPQEEIAVGPMENLMREHGALSRLLWIYEDEARRLRGGQDLHPEVLSGASRLVRRFVEDCHEKLEEDYIFPEFEKAGLLAELTKVLREQHRAGHRVTDHIMMLSAPTSLKNSADRLRLSEFLRMFLRMHRPHKAREETVLFPAFHRKIVTPAAFEALEEKFEDKERRLFGENGFEKVVAEVAQMEKALGTYDLAQYTPVGG
jgi:hemerythrin-like domain-containing protein